MAAPADDTRSQLAGAFAAAVAAVAPEQGGIAILVERPKDAAHGDYACNVAMQLAKTLKRPPREIASRLIAALPACQQVQKAEIAGAGFINIFLAPAYKQGVV